MAAPISITYQSVPVAELPSNLARFYDPVFYNYGQNGKGTLILEVYAKPIIQGSDLPPSLSLKELEVIGTFEGDFRDQFPPETGHNPREDFTRANRILDHISFALDTEKPCDNGVAPWIIPTLLESDERALWGAKLDVIQEYRLDHRHLTILKGGNILLECSVDKPS